MFETVLDKIRGLLGSKSLSDADFAEELDKKAAAKGLNWRISVVDFLTLVGIDSSRENRDALAAELGLPPDLKSGSAEKNEALRKAVFKKIAQSGGNVPKALMD
jgi:hypothetical protein